MNMDITEVSSRNGDKLVVPPFPSIKSQNSLINQYLTQEKWTRLCGIKTKTTGFTLEKAIACALKLDDQKFGFFCGDEDSYDEFREVFDPIIQHYHNLGPKSLHISDTDVNKIDGKFEDTAPIKSVRVRVGRSINRFGFPPGITTERRNEMEIMMKHVFQSLQSDLSGTYHSLGDMGNELKEQLVNDHYLFLSQDRIMESAGMMRDWPNGRGIFYNQTKTFIVWVNEEDNLRIISMEKGNDIKSVFKLLFHGVQAIQQCLEELYNRNFILHPKYGYLHSCPTNLGTGMRASVHIDLPGWKVEDEAALKARCRNLSLQCRGTGGENSKKTGFTYDISNRHRLGYTEVELLQILIQGVNTLFKEDLELQIKHGL